MYASTSSNKILITLLQQKKALTISAILVPDAARVEGKQP
jgi:hypothetical protein